MKHWSTHLGHAVGLPIEAVLPNGDQLIWGKTLDMCCHDGDPFLHLCCAIAVLVPRLIHQIPACQECSKGTGSITSLLGVDPKPICVLPRVSCVRSNISRFSPQRLPKSAQWQGTFDSVLPDQARLLLISVKMAHAVPPRISPTVQPLA